MIRRIGYIGLLAAVSSSAFLIGPANAGECDYLLEKAGQVSILTEQSQLYKEAQNKCPNDALVNYKYAFSLERLRKYDQALQYYNKASSLDKSSAKYLFGVADASRMANHIQGAVDAYQQGLKLQPGNVRAKKSLDAMLKKLAAMESLKKPAPPAQVKQVKKEEVKKKKIDLKLDFKNPNDQKIDMAFSTSSKKSTNKYFDILNDKQADDKKNWR